MIGVLIVAYRPRLDELRAALGAIGEAVRDGVPIAVHVWHNDAGPGQTEGLESLYERTHADGVSLTVDGRQRNLGFGRGINALLESVREPFVLVLNQDAIPEPGALLRLWRTASGDAPDVVAWEMRQIPFEHPKEYDPVTLDTGWCSGAAVLLRTDAFRQVGGFEPRIFMYGEDVDLCWRLRCAGGRLRYLPRCAVVHRTYSHPGEVKPLQVLEGCYANLCLRARFGSHRLVLDGLRQLVREMRGPQPFAGRRQGLARAAWKFARHWAYFRRSNRSAPRFEPCFRGWDYELRREGAFHAFLSAAEQPQPRPLVSMIVTTAGRPAALRRMLTCLAHQTHRPLQVVVVELGAGSGREICEEFARRLDIRHLALPATLGREEAFSRALTLAGGEWLGLADDEAHLLYADHVEVLLQAAIDQGAAVVSALATRATVEAAPAGVGPALLLQRRLAERSDLASGTGAAPGRQVSAWPRFADDVRRFEVAKTTSVRRMGSDE